MPFTSCYDLKPQRHKGNSPPRAALYIVYKNHQSVTLHFAITGQRRQERRMTWRPSAWRLVFIILFVSSWSKNESYLNNKPLKIRVKKCWLHAKSKLHTSCNTYTCIDCEWGAVEILRCKQRSLYHHVCLQNGLVPFCHTIHYVPWYYKLFSYRLLAQYRLCRVLLTVGQFAIFMLTTVYLSHWLSWLFQ